MPMAEIPDDRATIEALAHLRDVLARRVLARADRNRGVVDSGLTTAQHLALATIAEAPTGPSELASRQGVAISTATRMIHGLEKVGLVGPAAQATGDRRRRQVEITPAGRRALDDADAELRSRIAALVAMLEPGERQAVGDAARILGRVLDQLGPAGG